MKNIFYKIKIKSKMVYITPSFQILFDSKYDDKIKDLLQNFDIVMTPLLNPDGYIFAHNKKLKVGA